MSRASATRPCVALIVDNPLRDLDGLVLLAWQLVRRGVNAVLVPMYEQLFDVPALQPDLVLANYVRANNRDALKAYRATGSRVGILDTEGTGGKSAEEFARLVGATLGDTVIDLYCVWGESQADALRAAGVLPPHLLHATGCPRYDFCASPWRETLKSPGEPPGYLLINTNFPTVNPKFSRGAADERGAMLKAGFEAAFVDRYLVSARRAQRDVIALIGRLAARLPQARFVVRPHPFESLDPYRPLETPAGAGRSVRVIQRGTSLPWLRDCAALLHMNCSTAIEAVMLGREPLSPQWLNDDTLTVPAAQAVSRCAADEDELVSLLYAALEGRLPPAASALSAARESHVRTSYLRIDGEAAARVADAIVATLATTPRPQGGGAPRAVRSQLLALARGALGHRAFTTLRAALPFRRRSPAVAAAKTVSVGAVRTLLDRLHREDVAALDRAPPSVRLLSGGRAFSGQSILIEVG